MLRRIVDGCQYIIDAGFFGQCPGRTYSDTLSAGYAGGFTQTHLKRRTDIRMESALVCPDNTDALYVLTNRYAAAAEDTLGVVAQHVCRGIVDTGRGLIAVVIAFILHTQFFCKLLQFTVSASYAG